MRRVRNAFALSSLAALLASCGSNSAFSPIIPQKIQREIVAKFPSLAYVPTKLPVGGFFHYSDYEARGPHEFALDFSGPGGPQDLTVLVASVRRCIPGPAMHTFRVNGVLVRWAATYEDQEAHRCITHNGVTVWIFAGRSIPGDAGLATPQQRIDAALLARMVANIKYIH